MTHRVNHKRALGEIVGLKAEYPHAAGVLMPESDPYRVLGVAKDASDAEIKRAYRKLARQYHPDRNDDPAAEERFKRIQSAHEKIGDAEARSKFDQEQQMRNMFGGGGNPFGGGDPFGGGGNPFGGAGGMGGMDDLLQGLFGGRAGATSRGGSAGMGQQMRPDQRQSQPEKGADIRASLDISLRDAADGGSFPFTIRRLTKDGAGGVKSKAKTLSVKVKPGIEHAAVMRLSGMGHEHLHGEAGDVMLTIRIDAGEGRRWDDGALVQQVEVPFSTLILGGKVKITTPEGKTGNLTIPENSRIGDRRRMKGMGYVGGSLDLEFILAEIEELTSQQLQAIENLRQHGL
jgi:DnaJ-class molecular chaperone